MSDRTIHLHRVLRCPPERIYRAFLTPTAVAKWLPPFGFTCTVHAMDAVEGGHFRMSFESFADGSGNAFGGQYLELVPDQRIRYTNRFDNPGLPGEMQVTIDLLPVLCGTELRASQTGIPAVIPLEMCYLGWQESMTQLAQLVEVGGAD